uniref:DNA-directed RNA polymerase subunit n=1 Tax=Naja naja TaxID=35670 RepID=A0A8C6XZZ9_NAJNA
MVDGLEVGGLSHKGRLWNYAALLPLWSKRSSDPEEIVAPGIGSDDAGIALLLATMFVLVEMTDTVRIPPWQFERKLNDAITEELNKKLANKVVYNVGLCICLYDITKLEDSYIFPGDGASHTKGLTNISKFDLFSFVEKPQNSVFN